MNWEAIGAVGELLGAAVVFLTLLYLANQIKQANSVARFNTTREVMGQFDELKRLYATDSAIRKVMMKEGELSADESEQLYNFALMYCNAWAPGQTAFDEGQIDKALFDSIVKDVQVELSRWPNMQSATERWLKNYPDIGKYEVFRTIGRTS